MARHHLVRPPPPPLLNAYLVFKAYAPHIPCKDVFPSNPLFHLDNGRTTGYIPTHKGKDVTSLSCLSGTRPGLVIIIDIGVNKNTIELGYHHNSVAFRDACSSNQIKPPTHKTVKVPKLPTMKINPEKKKCECRPSSGVKWNAIVACMNC